MCVRNQTCLISIELKVLGLQIGNIGRSLPRKPLRIGSLNNLNLGNNCVSGNIRKYLYWLYYIKKAEERLLDFVEKLGSDDLQLHESDFLP